MKVSSTLTPATLVTATTGIINCLILPLQGQQLLVPQVNMAEMINFTELERPERAAPWFLGSIPWRGLTVPVVSYEVLNGHTLPADCSRVAIMNSLSTEEGGYYALVLQGQPRPAKVKLNELEDLLEAKDRLGPMDSLAVRWGGEMIIIPELDALEKVLAG